MPIARGLIVVSLISLSGCMTDNPSDDFVQYLTRVARVQDAPQVEIQAVNDYQLPRKRDLRIEIPNLSIGLLDSYQLRQCGLFNLIAERNSVLGKVADPFRHYDYQQALLEGLNNCLASEQIDEELKSQLAVITEQKHPELALHRWNLLYASDAMQRQLTGSQWLEPELSQTVTQVNQALDSLKLALNQTDISVTQAQEVLEKTPILGPLNYSLAHASAQLKRVTLQLNQYDAEIICAERRDRTKFKYLNNVFEQQYVANIQPYMAQLDSYYQQLTANLDLFAPQPHIHPYRYPLELNHQAFRLAIRDHVNYWQGLFKRCGRKLG